MAPVKSYQARVESYAPAWDDEHGVFVSGLPSLGSATFQQRFAAVMDSVTTASVEGVLMYLQRDCLDVGRRPTSAGCQRKNNASVVTFLEMEIAQPVAALAEYQDMRFVYPEFCPFVMMEAGACIPYDGLPDFAVLASEGQSAASATSSSDGDRQAIESLEDAVALTPAECRQFHGLSGQPKLGPCVGAQAFAADMVAPYMDTVWFSYPSGCVMRTWADGKSDGCRAAYPGGLCPFGTRPDGVTCSFAYKILGFLAIDDLVGITSMPVDGSMSDSGSTSASSSASSSDLASSSGSGSRSVNETDTFGSYAEFCAAGNVEFHSFDLDKTLGLSNVTSLPFWQSPSDLEANVNRTSAMIALYNSLAATDSWKRMTPLPSDLDAVTASNPPCLRNSKACFGAAFGCRRHSYAQVCSVCRSPGDGCVTRNQSSTFPALAKVPRSVRDAELRSGPLASLLVPTLSTSTTSAQAEASPATADPVQESAASSLRGGSWAVSMPLAAAVLLLGVV